MSNELDAKALEAARKAVENVLVDFRDSRISVFGGNGFMIREKDGKDSHIMRLSTKDGLAIGIKAYLAALSSSGIEAAGRVPQPTATEDAKES